MTTETTPAINSGADVVAAGICSADRGKPGHVCRWCPLPMAQIEAALATFWRRDDAGHIAEIYNQEAPALQWRRLREAQRGPSRGEVRES